ncbi:MAG: DNA mismatch repair protein MutL [Candidatus Omnitrophica bacterium CG11_big_fil_rev_8_21_14_0_20_64_10]|nr:MAG: DNA mismatch repair protein MutL [Candidatus Omnitrophica bacterium CG11_big_fil_rev_8_21_14_0_20_64_10]
MTGRPPMIRPLPESVANKIAAGEVVERPASIVKELIENALDAGARSVRVTVEHGGRGLIRVQDDGCGIPADQLKVAFQRHATSKLTALEELEKIGSFGFRGEALAAIGAVARVRLVSRPARQPEGAGIWVEGGAVKGVEPQAASPGTTVEVRDLFFNTPARRKFLKSEATEQGHLQEMVGRLALLRPEVRFTLTLDGKEALDLPAAGDLADRATRVLGKGTEGQWLPIDASQPGVRLTGLIARPAVSKANRSGQVLFVNRRLVRAPWIQYALQAGVHGRLMEGHYPVALLILEIDGARVDVNVHPTKQEVRVSNQSDVVRMIQDSLRERIAQAGDLAPALSPRGRSVSSGRSYTLRMPPRPVAPVSAGPAPDWAGVMERLSPETPLAEEGGPLPGPIVIRGGQPITRILGQLHRSYLVAETENGFLLVDQHAAHERVVFEALLKNLKRPDPEKQRLLLDELLELELKEAEPFAAILPTLTAVGFDIDPFGERSYAVRAMPAALGEVNPVALIRTVIEEREEGKLRSAVEERTEVVAALTACKRRSVKAGDSMTLPAAQQLLKQLAGCENPFNCPHGRPTIFTMTLAELERQFKRT